MTGEKGVRWRPSNVGRAGRAKHVLFGRHESQGCD